MNFTKKAETFQVQKCFVSHYKKDFINVQNYLTQYKMSMLSTVLLRFIKLTTYEFEDAVVEG